MDAVDVILKDGSTLRLRPPRRDDVERLVVFFAGLSDRSRYLRFHGIRAVDERLVEPVVDPDWVERGALVGTVGDGEEELVVALANYVRLRDPAVAEVAFTVADAYQRRGIGTRLLEQLAARASDHGMARFVAEVLADNRDMLGVFEHVGFELSRVLAGGELEVEFPISAGATYEERVAERDHVAVVASLRPFFEPRALAVIGASARRGSIGGELFRNVLKAGFTGAAYPVNRDGTPVSGVRAYQSSEEIPDDDLDLAVICVPARDVLDAARSALRHGVRALVVISAGFAEVGSEGAQLQEELLALVRSHGGRLIGPNCLGIAVAASSLDATFAARSAASGNIGFSSQSGALGLALLEAAVTRGLGLSAFVSIGNKADVSSNDLLEWWEDDDGTAAILLYLESFGNPRRFGTLARRVARKKPILALKSGVSASGQRAASSHTAALAGSETGVDALFRQAGVIRAGSLEELIDVATVVSSQPRLGGRNVALVTNAGGLGILAADACDAAGLALAAFGGETVELLRAVLPDEASVANPVDMLGGATAASYGAVVPTLLADPGVDALVALFVPAVSATADEVAAAIERAAVEADVEKPVLAVVISAEGVPAVFRSKSRRVAPFSYPESAARALGRAAERSEWLRRPQGTIPELPGIDKAAGDAVVSGALARGDDVWLTAGEVRTLLVAYGVPLVPEEVAGDADEAVAAARRLGLPVVVKSAVPGAHKTERGGIALDLDTEESVRQAAERIGYPVLVQQMVVGGAELLAGMVQDPVFGPLVAFGPGGVMAELIGEASFRLVPLTDVDADELVTTGKAGRLVAGFRGAPASDTGALADLVHRLGRLGGDHPAIAEVDLNPVLGSPAGCVAVDARVRVRPPDTVERRKSW